MKRFLIVLLVMLLALVGGLAAGLFVAPDRVQQIWGSLGLPAQGFVWLAGRGPASQIGEDLPGDRPSAVTASGFLEAEETAIVAELGGQVVEVLAVEGQAVTAGQPLVRLDDSLLLAQLEQAEQALASAQTALELAQAGPRPAEIAAAQAQVQQAQASLDGARQALADAQAARADPQQLLARINAAQGRVALGQRQIEVQAARQAVIRVLRESIANDGSDQGQTQQAIYDQQQAAAAENSAAAEAELLGAQRALNALRQMRANPVSADVQVRAAESQVRLAEQALAVAQAGLALAAAGPQPEAVALAVAQVAKAEAARNAVAAPLAKTTLTSPSDGVVLLRAVEPGETIAPATPLLKVADLSRMTLTVYVPLERIGQVQVGQPAQISVDAYPDRTFDGVVTALASQAEFTPKNILATGERSEAVFAVTIALLGDNLDDALKPGMVADVLLRAP
ncbi:MAG TPA: HlyD family efflux transporter periplasmic adaptor subunit [Anaerolineae bacterium]|nr:HlyD family efflux transporter periplasmic adaptor subunit [Anaerolineae bacterium]